MAKWQVKATGPHSASETRSSATVAKRWSHMLHFPNKSGDIEDDMDDPSSSGRVPTASGNPLSTQPPEIRKRERCNNREKEPQG